MRILPLLFLGQSITMPFTRNVEVGRVALCNYGSDFGKLVIITDVVDQNKVNICACIIPWLLKFGKKIWGGTWSGICASCESLIKSNVHLMAAWRKMLTLLWRMEVRYFGMHYVLSSCDGTRLQAVQAGWLSRIDFEPSPEPLSGLASS